MKDYIGLDALQRGESLLELAKIGHDDLDFAKLR
jgi:hypothetical protein